MKFTIATYLKLIIITLATTCLSATDGEYKYRFSGVPALGFGPESGFGTGIVGTMYVDQDDIQPYKMALGLKAYISLKGMQSHAVTFDQVDAFGLPLRLTSRLGFFSTVEQNYCGQGNAVSCDENRAAIAADKAHLTGEDRETFIRRYYSNRFMSFFGDVYSRWLLWKNEAKLELLASYRGRYYLSGDFKHRGPYAGSLYAQDFNGKKTDGYLSTLEVGVMLDKRNNEPSPTSGYWLESTVRGGSWLTGSVWKLFRHQRCCALLSAFR